VMHNLAICILVCNVDSPGGMERQARSLGKKLAEKGINVTIVSNIFVRKIEGSHSFPWYKKNEDGIDIYRIPVKEWGILVRPILYSLFLLLLFLLRKRYQIIYGVQLFSGGGIAALAGKLLNKPFAIKLAGGGCCGDIAMFRKLPLVSLTKRFAKWADAYVSLSKEIESELREAGFNSGKIIGIPNGVDTSLFYPACGIDEKKELKMNLSLPDKRIIAFVGRLDSQKRAHLLIEVFKEVQKIYADTHLVIIGDGPDNGKIKNMADVNISLLGTVNNVNEYLRASDLLVHPSLSEGMSNVILEAMATGLPVITTNVSSNPEIIDNGINGILLDINDITGLKENILKILSDDAFSNRLGKNAKEKIDIDFTIGTVAEKYIGLFNNLLTRGKK